MKEHLINQKKENKLLAYIHKIILGALISIILYNLAFKYRKGNYNFFSLEEINQKDIKKLYQRYFHLCFSISASVPFLFFTNILLNSNNNLPLDTSIINIALLLSPFVLNIMETIIIKRFKPLYLHIILLLVGIITYYFIIYFFGKMGMNIGDFASERLSEIKFIIQLCIFTIIGAFGGWWLYKFLTKPKIKKIDLSSSASSELSEE